MVFVDRKLYKLLISSDIMTARDELGMYESDPELNARIRETLASQRNLSSQERDYLNNKRFIELVEKSNLLFSSNKRLRIKSLKFLGVTHVVRGVQGTDLHIALNHATSQELYYSLLMNYELAREENRTWDLQR